MHKSELFISTVHHRLFIKALLSNHLKLKTLSRRKVSLLMLQKSYEDFLLIFFYVVYIIDY